MIIGQNEYWSSGSTCGRGRGEVGLGVGGEGGAHLEDDAHRGGHLDDLAVGQAQLAIVVEHGVHVLDPQGIHWSIQDQPFSGWAGVTRQLLECHSQHSILHETINQIEIPRARRGVGGQRGGGGGDPTTNGPQGGVHVGTPGPHRLGGW